MGIANFPFPSFTFVLTSDCVVIPGPSYVIRFAPLVVLHPHAPQSTGLTADVANEDIVEEDCPLANLNFENDSIPDVVLGHSDTEELAYDATEMVSVSKHDTRTVQTTDKARNQSSLLKIRFRFKSIFKHSPMVTYSN